MQRLAIFIGSLFASCIFLWHWFNGRDILYCAWMALMVLMVGTIVIMFAMKWIGSVLMDHLKDQRDELEAPGISPDDSENKEQ